MPVQLLTFDAETHTYRHAGRVVQSVTQILACACSFDFITAEQLAAAQARGTYTHALCEFSDLDCLDDDKERDGEHWPRLLAWRQFCSDYGANWSNIETVGYSDLFNFAGTVDRRGKLERTKTPNDLWVIDVKTGATVSKTWGPQTAAYKQIAIEEHPRWVMARRATVRLLENGTYKFDEFRDPRDWEIFQALNTLSHWSNSNA